MFPKLWNAIEINLKERRAVNIYFENYERFQCENTSWMISRE